MSLINKMDLQTTPTMPFTTFLKSISIDKDMYINNLKVKLKKPTIGLQKITSWQHRMIQTYG
jgi:hypothetical protein